MTTGGALVSSMQNLTTYHSRTTCFHMKLLVRKADMQGFDPSPMVTHSARVFEGHQAKAAVCSVTSTDGG
jgi:hypothetical protein